MVRYTTIGRALVGAALWLVILSAVGMHALHSNALLIEWLLGAIGFLIFLWLVANDTSGIEQQMAAEERAADEEEDSDEDLGPDLGEPDLGPDLTTHGMAIPAIPVTGQGQGQGQD